MCQALQPRVPSDYKYKYVSVARKRNEVFGPKLHALPNHSGASGAHSSSLMCQPEISRFRVRVYALQDTTFPNYTALGIPY